MNKEIKNGFYASPKVEMIEIKAWQVICQSGTTQQYEDEDTDGWYD